MKCYFDLTTNFWFSSLIRIFMLSFIIFFMTHTNHAQNLIPNKNIQFDLMNKKSSDPIIELDQKYLDAQKRNKVGNVVFLSGASLIGMSLFLDSLPDLSGEKPENFNSMKITGIITGGLGIMLKLNARNQKKQILEDYSRGDNGSIYKNSKENAKSISTTTDGIIFSLKF